MLPTGAIPSRLSAIVGDIIHNARSSLDTVALAVCEFGNGGKLSVHDEESVQFPITNSPARFDNAVEKRLPYTKDGAHRVHPHQAAVVPVQRASEPDDEQRNESIRHDDLSTHSAPLQYRQAPSGSPHRLVAVRHLRGLKRNREGGLGRPNHPGRPLAAR